ncbi:MAG TPA: enoyl-CoA hydratase/isomerase family protein [Iamia sp.]|nr:enoyl-CoA hydratase/isomerase family protein [Iamia sp.]
MTPAEIDSDALVQARHHDGWVEVHLDRPERRNALSHALVDQLVAALQAAADDGVRVAVLSAAAPVFCAGGDREEVHTRPVASDRLLELLRETELFVIARVEGPVLGAGVAVVRSCPVAIGTPEAGFSLPEARMGVFPEPVAYLEGTVSRRRALDVAVRSRFIPAAEAEAAGLLTVMVAPEEVDDEVASWVAILRERPEVADQARLHWRREVDRECRGRAAWLRAVVAKGQR